MQNDDDFSPLIVADFADTEWQVNDHVKSYLRGAIDEGKLLARIAPIFEDTASPTAQQIVGWLDALSWRAIDKQQFRRALEELIDNQAQGVLH